MYDLPAHIKLLGALPPLVPVLVNHLKLLLNVPSINLGTLHAGHPGLAGTGLHMPPRLQGPTCRLKAPLASGLLHLVNFLNPPLGNLCSLRARHSGLANTAIPLALASNNLRQHRSQRLRTVRQHRLQLQRERHLLQLLYNHRRRQLQYQHQLLVSLRIPQLQHQLQHQLHHPKPPQHQPMPHPGTSAWTSVSHSRTA
jgi:hypothetical protein